MFIIFACIVHGWILPSVSFANSRQVLLPLQVLLKNKNCRLVHVIPESFDSLIDQKTIFIPEPFTGFQVQHIRETGISRPYSRNEITAVFSLAEVIVFYTFLIDL